MVGNPKRKLLYMKNVLVGFVVGFKYNRMSPFIWICWWGEDMVLDMYGCCNVAHAKRTLHIKHPKNKSNAMLYGEPKRKTI